MGQDRNRFGNGISKLEEFEPVNLFSEAGSATLGKGNVAAHGALHRMGRAQCAGLTGSKAGSSGYARPRRRAPVNGNDGDGSAAPDRPEAGRHQVAWSRKRRGDPPRGMTGQPQARVRAGLACAVPGSLVSTDPWVCRLRSLYIYIAPWALKGNAQF